MIPMTNYTYEKKCEECGNVDIYPLSKIETAFNHELNSKFPSCTNCGSNKYISSYRSFPKLDKELLDLWGVDSNLYFFEQDEEIMLAEIENLPLLLEAIDNPNYLDQKIGVLAETLCVILYDNSFPDEDEDFTEDELDERSKIVAEVLPQLIIRKELLEKHRNSIMDYIQEVAFPQIGIKIE